MSKRPHPFHVHVPTWPVDIWEKLRRLATRNRRTIKAEAMIAIERHLQNEGELTNAEIGLLLQSGNDED